MHALYVEHLAIDGKSQPESHLCGVSPRILHDSTSKAAYPPLPHLPLSRAPFHSRHPSRTTPYIDPGSPALRMIFTQLRHYDYTYASN